MIGRWEKTLDQQDLSKDFYCINSDILIAMFFNIANYAGDKTPGVIESFITTLENDATILIRWFQKGILALYVKTKFSQFNNSNKDNSVTIHHRNLQRITIEMYNIISLNLIIPTN